MPVRPSLLATLLLAAACGRAPAPTPPVATANRLPPAEPVPAAPVAAERPALPPIDVAELDDGDPDAPPTWANLEASTFFALGGIGYAGVTSPGEAATRVLATTPGAVDRFDHLATTGTPAAKLYAVWALQSLDPERAAPHLARLAVDPTPVEVMGGCMRFRQTVAEAVAGELTGPGARRLNP